MVQINKKLLLSIGAIVLFTVTVLSTILITGVLNKKNDINSENTTAIIETTQNENTDETVPDNNNTNDTNQTTSDSTTNSTQNTTNENTTSQTTNNTRPTVTDDDAKKENNTSNTTTSTQTTQKDNSVFTTYNAFISSMAASNYSFSKQPSVSDLKTSCDCGISFSGDFANGSVTIKSIKNHTHGWGTTFPNHGLAPNSFTTHGTIALNSSQNISSILEVCDECGFVKGENFIFVKLPNKNHGHGWSWPIFSTPTHQTQAISHAWSCGCVLHGDYENGYIDLLIEGILSDGSLYPHSHSWGSIAVNSTNNNSTNNNSTSGGQTLVQGFTGIQGTASESSSVSSSSVSTSQGLHGLQQNVQNNTSSNQTTGSIGISNPQGITGIESSAVSGSSNTHGVTTNIDGAPPCGLCGFRKWSNIYGEKHIAFKCPKTGETHSLQW